MTPVFLEEIQWETSRASRRFLLRMDFDASSCFDRIILNIASLAARSSGQHEVCSIHGNFIRQAKFFLKTTFDFQKRHIPIATYIRSMVHVEELQTALHQQESEPIYHFYIQYSLSKRNGKEWY
jgi:hypothetical protein